jgi:hypothetical protein
MTGCVGCMKISRISSTDTEISFNLMPKSVPSS